MAMDPKSKYLFLVMGLLIVGILALTYWQIMVKKNYIVEAQTDCDPSVQKCFIWECDPSSSEEGEACTGDAEKDTWYYSIVRRNAGQIPLCDPNEESCTAFVCGENEPECEEIFCDEETGKAQGVVCSNPADHVQTTPVTEEENREQSNLDNTTTSSESQAGASTP